MRLAAPASVLTLLLLSLFSAVGARSALAGRTPQRHVLTTPAATGFVPGELLVVLPEGAAVRSRPGGALEVRDGAVSAALEAEELGLSEDLAPSSAPARFVRLVSRRAEFDPLAAAARLRGTGLFRAVMPNYRLYLSETLPNDTYLGDQWYVDEPTGADVHLPEAWDVAQGSPSTVIGIMDTGIDIGHPDLAANLWANPGEIPANGVDDDGNGYIDDMHGWDFGNGDSDPNPEPTYEPSGIDVGFHGTFVAGIASAVTNNGVGIAGAGWQCRLMALKVSNSAGEITSAAITLAFDYACAQHVAVLNMSLGGPGDPGVPEYFQALVNTAVASGVLCVAAAGNDGTDDRSYPAGCDNVLSVAATDWTDARAEFSNWGSWVRIAAPGAGMWSSICRNYTFDDLNQIFYLYFFGWDGENPYMFGDGTSFACPLAAGVAALVRAHTPSFTALATYQQLITSGDVVTYDQQIGPKLNAFRALTQIPTSVGSARSIGLVARATPNPFVRSTVLRFATPTAGSARLTLFDCAGRRVRDLVRGPVEAGEHEARWDGTSASGERLASGVYFARLEWNGVARQSRVLLLR
jgi:subtilisin family serine protease